MKIIPFSLAMLAIALLAACSEPSTSSPDTTEKTIALDVYKSPTCGCCGLWVNHIEDNGFEPTIHNLNSLDSIKKKYAVPAHLQSCHTGVSQEGFFFEGHIPAKYIEQFLANPPVDAAGLSVPGMPAGSPGMEMGARFDAYDVLLVKKDGSSEVYARVTSPEGQK